MPRIEDDEYSNPMVVAMLLAGIVELATKLNFTIDCDGNYISIIKWNGTPLTNEGGADPEYIADDIRSILSWLDAIDYERIKPINLS